MDITVLKKITMGRTWGWVEDKSGHRLTLIPAVLVGFRSISSFLPPFSPLKCHQNTGNFSWINNTFIRQLPHLQTVSSNLFRINLSVFHRKLKKKSYYDGPSLLQFLENSDILGRKFIIIRSRNWKPLADILVILIFNRHRSHYLLSQQPGSKLTASNLRSLFIVVTQ